MYIKKIIVSNQGNIKIFGYKYYDNNEHESYVV